MNEYISSNSRSNRKIDYGYNEELFLSLCAINDCNDDHQWFISGDKWMYAAKSSDLVQLLIPPSTTNYRKATPDDLLSRFSNKINPGASYVIVESISTTQMTISNQVIYGSTNYNDTLNRLLSLSDSELVTYSLYYVDGDNVVLLNKLPNL